MKFYIVSLRMIFDPIYGFKIQALFTFTNLRVRIVPPQAVIRRDNKMLACDWLLAGISRQSQFLELGECCCWSVFAAN